MDYVIPAEVVSDALTAAVKKSNLSISDFLIRGALSGVFLGYATSLVFVALFKDCLPSSARSSFRSVSSYSCCSASSWQPETSLFSRQHGSISAFLGALLRNWIWVLIGNLLGSLLYAGLFYLAITNFGTNNGGAVADLVRQRLRRKRLPMRHWD